VRRNDSKTEDAVPVAGIVPVAEGVAGINVAPIAAAHLFSFHFLTFLLVGITIRKQSSRRVENQRFSTGCRDTVSRAFGYYLALSWNNFMTSSCTFWHFMSSVIHGSLSIIADMFGLLNMVVLKFPCFY